MKNTLVGAGLPKSDLILEFWAFRDCFLKRIQRRIYSPECAEDIFQTACLRFMTSPAVFKYPEAGTKYFCRILHSLIVDHIERAARLEYRETLPEVVCDPWAEWERDSRTERVADALRCLPAKDRHLLAVFLDPALARLRDKGNALRIPSSTMRYRVSRIFCKVRKTIRQES